jgi:hypothetical protein
MNMPSRSNKGDFEDVMTRVIDEVIVDQLEGKIKGQMQSIERRDVSDRSKKLVKERGKGDEKHILEKCFKSL